MPTLNPTSLLFIPSPSFTTTSDIPTSTPGGAFGAPSAGESLSPGRIFDGGGGPALVVVFVAIGLLIGAFTALLIVRRMSTGRITFDDYEGQANGLAMWRYYEATEVPLGEEPKLFEMRLEREKGVKEGNERWRGMSVSDRCGFVFDWNTFIDTAFLVNSLYLRNLFQTRCKLPRTSEWRSRQSPIQGGPLVLHGDGSLQYLEFLPPSVTTTSPARVYKEPPLSRPRTVYSLSKRHRGFRLLGGCRYL